MSGRVRVPAWAWIIALVPLTIFGLAVASRLSIYGLRQYQARGKLAEASPAIALPRASASVPTPLLGGEATDLSSVMGRARKLANQWQTEAALLGIEAVLARGKVQTQDGASAKLTFGPSRFANAHPTSQLFVVVYDKNGLSGAPAEGRAGKALPEPMCAPEHVLLRLADFGTSPLVLRYGFDRYERALWFASPAGEPQRLRVFDPRDCGQRGNVVVAPRPKR